jgi:hypothetical protein
VFLHDRAFVARNPAYSTQPDSAEATEKDDPDCNLSHHYH